ncbi:hypothetical protein BC940DRAFT_301487 [Gongronella butleri]|nr:hypothetical protein BC940DRAFT_301487 [Gongronella butleri]
MPLAFSPHSLFFRYSLFSLLPYRFKPFQWPRCATLPHRGRFLLDDRHAYLFSLYILLIQVIFIDSLACVTHLLSPSFFFSLRRIGSAMNKEKKGGQSSLVPPSPAHGPVLSPRNLFWCLDPHSNDLIDPIHVHSSSLSLGRARARARDASFSSSFFDFSSFPFLLTDEIKQNCMRWTHSDGKPRARQGDALKNREKNTTI